MKLTSSWDDGCASDVRVAELMEKYEIPTVFYWPVEWHSLAYDKGYAPLTYSEACGIADDFEVGSHTVTHRHLTSLEWNDAYREMADSQRMLTKLFGQRVVKFCPPRGYTNKALTENAESIYQSQRLTKGPNLVHVHPNSGANENRPWREVAKAKLAAGQEIEIWGHSHECDRFDLWSELEAFLKESA